MKTILKIVLIAVVILGAGLAVSHRSEAQAVVSAATCSLTTHTGNWWYTSDPSRISINGCTGAMKAYSAGMATICVQRSVALREPVQCFTVIVGQVVNPQP